MPFCDAAAATATHKWASQVGARARSSGGDSSHGDRSWRSDDKATHRLHENRLARARLAVQLLLQQLDGYRIST
jgi:hypothetical protein